MLRFIIGEERLDANLLDTDGETGDYFWDTDCVYAAVEQGGLDTVWYLLVRGVRGVKDY